jgi:hypothetical protein
VSDWREDEATNQTRFRDINESIVMDIGEPAVRELTDAFVCECGDGACREPIHLSHEEYETVRRDPTWFAIALDHENPEIDRVVVEYARYAVVQKTLATAVKIARQTDPRAWRAGPGVGEMRAAAAPDPVPPIP